MLRIIGSTFFVSSLFLMVSAAEASSSKVSYEFTASADKATVTIVRLKNRTFKKIGTCTTPCTLQLKPKHVDYFVFQHDDYAPLELSSDDFAAAPNEQSPSIQVYGNLGVSYSEKKAEAERKYQTARSAALAKLSSKAKPWQRVPPLYPVQSLRDSRSGWCQVRFDVNIQGQTENVSAFNCSESTFQKNAEASVQKWIYIPAVKNGEFVSETGLESMITFRFDDEDGETIPPKIPPPK